MNEKLKLALEKLEQNPELKEEVTKNPPKNAEEIITIAARLGVKLTKDDLKPESKEMSLEEADRLAGGDKVDNVGDVCDTGVCVVCGAVIASALWFTGD